MAVCTACGIPVDEAVMMACRHHLCLPCACSRMEGDREVRCQCRAITRLTEEAHQTLVARNCHNVALCEPVACGRTSPRREHNYHTHHIPTTPPNDVCPMPDGGISDDAINKRACLSNAREPTPYGVANRERSVAPDKKRCAQHPGETSNFWCIDCGKFICPECGMVGEHYGHNFRTMRQQATEVQQQLQASVAVLNTYSREAGRDCEKIESQSRGVDLLVNNSKKILRKQVERIIRDLELYQENMEKAYTEAAEQCSVVLQQACEASIKAEENYRMHANDISMAISAPEADLVDWFGKTQGTIDKLCSDAPLFLDVWPYVESSPGELNIFWDGKPLISTKIPKLWSCDIPEVGVQSRLPRT